MIYACFMWQFNENVEDEHRKEKENNNKRKISWIYCFVIFGL